MAPSLAGLVAIGVLVGCKDHLFLKNVQVIEADAIYRGAEQKKGPLRRLIQRYGIRTIVCLVDPEPNEQAIARSLDVRWVWVPIGDSSLSATFDALEQLAAVLADPASRPVFYHCRRGVYRSNLGQAVYRMKHCHWTLDQALAELRAAGFDPEGSGGDSCCVEVLKTYYEERVLSAMQRAN